MNTFINSTDPNGVQNAETPDQIGGEATTQADVSIAKTDANIVAANQTEGGVTMNEVAATNLNQTLNSAGEPTMQANAKVEDTNLIEASNQIVASYPEGVNPLKADGSHETATGIRSEEITLDISSITRRASHCYREQRDEANVEGLRIAYLENKKAEERGELPIHIIPRIKVWFDPEPAPGEYVLVGGDHRTEGATMAGLTTIPAIVFYCTSNEAYWIGLADNSTHGLQLSKGDKKTVIETMLQRFQDMPYREIARRLKCAYSYVSDIANKLIQAGLLEGKRKRKQSNDTQTGNRRGRKKQPPDDASRNAPQAEGMPEKSLTERKAYAYEHIENLADDMPVQEAVDFLEAYIKRCEYICNYRKGIANGNGAPRASDQSTEAT